MDLSSAEGLRKLEEYLSKRDFSPLAHEEAGENETSNRFKTPSPGTLSCSASVSLHLSNRLLNQQLSAFVDVTPGFQASPKSSATPSPSVPSWTRVTTSAWRR